MRSSAFVGGATSISLPGFSDSGGMAGGVCRQTSSPAGWAAAGAGGMRRAEADSGIFRPSTVTGGGRVAACLYAVSPMQALREAQPASRVAARTRTVSYTHLTLPTILLV